MELILREDIQNLGRRGDIVKVKSGYGRNYLLPSKLAVPLTEGNKKAVEQQRVATLKRDSLEKSQAEQLGAILGKVSLSFARKAGESGLLFGSVTSIDLAEALAKNGYDIDRRKILLEDPIKQLSEVQVPVRLHRDVTVSFTVQVVAETES